MAPIGDEPARDELDDFVRAFELAFARDGRGEIAAFLPPPGHPLRMPVLRELVRVDLEYGWERGRPRPVSEYQRAFPELGDDLEALSEIGFEDSRLRRQAQGSGASARLDDPGGVALDDGSSRWPAALGAASRLAGRLPEGLVAGDAGMRSRLDPMGRAARAYREFLDEFDGDDESELDSWCESVPVGPDYAQLFRDAHRSDRRAADRLARGVAALPAVGDSFLGFRLIGELGRGAFGKVYLARQGDLADRPVALKVSPVLFDESQTLARLQHTNIVPIYSMHRVEPLQAVCMPYFGATTLRDVYEDLQDQAALPLSGQGLLSTLNGRKASSRLQADPGSSLGPAELLPAEPPAAKGPGRREDPPAADTLAMLGGMTYIEAVLWMAARLADALAHAHERGILHRDLKPANILITDEGQPMLLDFNLSEDLKAHSGAAAAVGGTLPYMSPEQLDALRGGDRRPDARSDLYSLGIILYGLLTGRHPFDTPRVPARLAPARMLGDRSGPPPTLRRWNPSISPAVESIVRRCLEPEPARRYQSAGELREDLERHLAHRPLKHAAEPSMRERAAKFARRHPTLCGATSLTLLALTLASALGASGWLAVEEGRKASARLLRQEFRKEFNQGHFLREAGGGPPARLRLEVELARRALARYGVEGEGDWTAGPMVRRLPPGEQRALREEASELVLMEAQASVELAAGADAEAERRRALERAVVLLDRAERFDPRPPAALYEERGRFQSALGRPDLASRDQAQAARVPPSSARDHYLLGSSLLARARPDRAEAHLARAVALDARRFWAWFYLGVCHFDQGRYPEAAADFSLATVIAPDFAWPHLNRGLALARSGRLPEARAAYDRALDLDPDFPEALVDRALACLELDEPGQALCDLDRVVALGRRNPSILAAKGEALARLGRRAAAESLFSEAIREAPTDPSPRVARGYSRLETDRAGAEADFARALDLDPHLARAHLGRALLLRRDDLRAALAEAGRALEDDPRLGDALQLRTLLRARLGDPGTLGDVDRLLEVPTPRRLYNAACAVSLLSRTRPEPGLIPRALDLLRRALDAGLPPSCLAGDPDLDPLRKSPGFLAPSEAIGKTSASSGGR